jgi:hypothetical protein
VLVGTKKGAFLFWSDESRKAWSHSEHHVGWMTHTVTYDPRHDAIYAGTTSWVFGGLVQRSADHGATWEHFNQGLDFPADEERRVREIWQVQAGHTEHPDQVWAGTGEAGLFVSNDRGTTWSGVEALNNRKSSDVWNPGGGGLILHTILPDASDPNRIYVAVSAGGAYRSDDAGASWKPINRGIPVDFLPDPTSETGTCVHKMVYNPLRPNVLFQQNHGGFYRSEDYGDNWTDISEGMPSRFGFPMAIHPHDPRTVYAVPLQSDDRRVTPEGQMAVWRTRDDGNSWSGLTSGLPGDAWLTILRDALATDDCEECGVYVGDTGGHLFYSRDEGESWQIMANFLPPILSIRAARVVG